MRHATPLFRNAIDDDAPPAEPVFPPPQSKRPDDELNTLETLEAALAAIDKQVNKQPKGEK